MRLPDTSHERHAITLECDCSNTAVGDAASLQAADWRWYESIYGDVTAAHCPACVRVMRAVAEDIVTHGRRASA